MEKHFFEYGERETEYLKSKDAVLGAAIDRIGHIHREVIPDLFTALMNSMIGQQISAKAQKTVWTRFQTMFAPLTAEHIADIPDEVLQACGISYKKAAYIKGIAQGVVDSSIDLDGLVSLSDDEVRRRLSAIKGVGAWTAEMLMIFSMQRPNIISAGDLGIIRGLRVLYRHRKITPQLFEKYKRRYSPYATVASLYLWQISHGDDEVEDAKSLI